MHVPLDPPEQERNQRIQHCLVEQSVPAFHHTRAEPKIKLQYTLYTLSTCKACYISNEQNQSSKINI